MILLKRKSSLLGFILTTSVTMSMAQGASDRFEVPLRSLPIVSIGALRIPDKAWKHFDKAKLLAARDRATEAEVESRRAIRIAPQFASAYLLCASAQIAQHDFTSAITSLDAAVGIEPYIRWSGVLRASAYNGLNRYAEAQAVLGLLRVPESTSWQAAYEHARASIGMGDVPSSLRWSEEALIGAPSSFADARLLRANALLLARRWDDAHTQMVSYMEANRPAERRAEVLDALRVVEMHVRDGESECPPSRATSPAANAQDPGSSLRRAIVSGQVGTAEYPVQE